MHDKILARDLLKVNPANLLSLLPDKFVLVFDDGEIKTTRRRTHVSSYFWEFHKVFPRTKLNKNHHVQVILKGKPYHSNTHTELLEAICRSVYEEYEDVEEEINSLTSKLAFRVTNNMMDEMAPHLAPFPQTLDLLDAIAISRHPRIIAAIEEAQPTGSGVDSIYKVARDVIENDPDLAENSLVLAYRSNTVNKIQVLQSISVRGTPTEANGKLFDIPIMSGYLEGLTKIYDFASDSRSAPKALSSTEKPLQDSSYLDRRLQFLTTVVRKIKGKDCGGEFVDFLIDKEVRDESNRIVYPGGISSMAGKYVEDPETKKLVELIGNETHLNGRYVRMRSVLKCRNIDPHTVCKTCFGGLWRNYYNHQNIGHLCVVTMMKKIIQNTLSTKHLVASGEGAPIRLNSASGKFFLLQRNKTLFYLQPVLKKMSLKIIFNRDEAINLIDVVKMEHIENLRINDTTKITSVKMCYREKGKDLSDIVKVEQSGREAFLTLPMIKYVRDHSWTVDGNNNFSIDMKDWDFDIPVMAIPQMEISYSQHGAEVGKMIESNMNSIDERQRPDSPLATLQELSSLVISKLDIPLSCLEVIIYASMIPSRNNHSMARGWDNSVLGIARNTIYSRSLSCAYAFQGHSDFMLDPKSFFPHFRPDNQMDVFFAPDKVIEEFKRQSV